MTFDYYDDDGAIFRRPKGDRSAATVRAMEMWNAQRRAWVPAPTTERSLRAAAFGTPISAAEAQATEPAITIERE